MDLREQITCAVGANRRSETTHRAAIAVRIAAIVLFVALTNAGAVQRIDLLIGQERPGTLVGFLGVWGMSLAALIVAAFQPRLIVRAFWAAVVAVTTAIGFGYRNASGNELGVMDVISLWNVRHEAARASQFYADHMTPAILVLILGFLVLVTPPAVRSPFARRWLPRLAWAPAVPVVAVAGIMFLKEGGGAQSLPVQFAPLSVGIVSGVAIANSPSVDRMPVAANAGDPAIRNVVVIVDESIRPDYLDWNPGNPFTPRVAARRDSFVDFGPAASGGTCSHYSNAILRFTASRDDLGGDILSNPTIWQYARGAGFRTVFIDAQAAFNRNAGKLQNFMTTDETADIDAFHAMEEATPVPELDDVLLDVLLDELQGDGPTFVYATKNGAHFPYDLSYPESEAAFEPTMSQAGSDRTESRVNSYRNAVRWATDRFLARLVDEVDLADTVVIFTSDHGQAFDPAAFSHCSVENPDPREALVPLMAITGDETLRARFEAGAAAGLGRASHFEIMPTVIELMGYGAEEARTAGRETMFTGAVAAPGFSTGDIFGLFSHTVRWHPIDLDADYRETGPAIAAVRAD